MRPIVTVIVGCEVGVDGFSMAIRGADGDSRRSNVGAGASVVRFAGATAGAGALEGFDDGEGSATRSTARSSRADVSPVCTLLQDRCSI